MKGILRSVLFNAVSIYAASMFISGLSYSNSLKVLFLSGAALTLAGYVVKPIIKIVTLPINFITLGVFSWVIDVFILYIVTVLVPDLTISGFTFNGFTHNGFIVPSFSLSQFWSFAVVSFAIAVFTSLLNYICA